MRKWIILFILFSSYFAKADFYQTAFLSQDPMSAPTWKDLHFSEALLQKSVSALTGDLFPQRPPEWEYYFLNDRFEDEDPSCLNNSKNWKLVALRAIPISAPSHSPELRLTFQPYCFFNSSSDTSLQVILSGGKPDPLWDWIATQKRTSFLDFKDLGFVDTMTFFKSHESPADFPNNIVQKINDLRRHNYHPRKVQWMASTHGQLDWIFGRLELKNGDWLPENLSMHSPNGKISLELGQYDFLPLVLREVYQNLSSADKKEIATLIATEDLHESLSTAQRVLAIDLAVSDPYRTHHQNTSCIQCHSAQERMERAQNFINYGGAMEFGYFFRGLGYIADRPYASWRSLQESRYWHEKIKTHKLRNRRSSVASRTEHTIYRSNPEVH